MNFFEKLIKKNEFCFGITKTVKLRIAIVNTLSQSRIAKDMNNKCVLLAKHEKNKLDSLHKLSNLCNNKLENIEKFDLEHLQDSPLKFLQLNNCDIRSIHPNIFIFLNKY